MCQMGLSTGSFELKSSVYLVTILHSLKITYQVFLHCTISCATLKMQKNCVFLIIMTCNLAMLPVLTEHVCRLSVTSSGQWAPMCFRASSSSCERRQRKDIGHLKSDYTGILSPSTPLGIIKYNSTTPHKPLQALHLQLNKHEVESKHLVTQVFPLYCVFYLLNEWYVIFTELHGGLFLR